jgi:hypothetical protein
MCNYPGHGFISMDVSEEYQKPYQAVIPLSIISAVILLTLVIGDKHIYIIG